jgi:thiol-disulfide isomerase/thioredoxin
MKINQLLLAMRHPAAVPLPFEGELPSLSGATAWLNSPPLSADDLRGKVVIIDFWTYTCINWLRTLPYVRAWAEKYQDHGLVVIGVHTPEFSFEHDIENVRRAARDMRVSYPIAIDNDYAIWSAFANHYWPALYFVDAQGQLRHHLHDTGGEDMSEGFFSRGFRGRREMREISGRLPPGQYLERGFPVLSAGPTPHTPLANWDFSLVGEIDQPKRWHWDGFRALPHETITKDIHCVTKWSKLDTHWEGVSLDTLLAQVTTAVSYVIAFSDGGYTTNLPLDEVLNGQAWIVDTYEGQPLEPQHGGPARLLVPHLYFWKSAKWVRGLRLVEHDEPGFWESLGYHNHGDPWKGERYWND